MLARFYRGSALYRLGRLDEAVATLEAVVEQSGAGETLGATARVMLARVHVAAGQREQAILLLESILDQPDRLIPPDVALLELGRIHSNGGNAEQAHLLWQRVVDEYPLTISAPEARLLLR
jgi:TolA-binding protein